ncbi:MAG: hypothetical protein AB1817_01885, partial [Chloroflexota bacterium]
MSALDLTSTLKQHRPFAALSSVGLALMYAELGWASYNFWSHRSSNEALTLTVAMTLLAFGGYLISFFVPPLLVRDTWDHPRAWGVFSNVTIWSIGITIALNVIEFGLLLYLVKFDLVASYTLLRDVYVYTLFAILFFHGLLLYVRYVTFLYQTPDHVQPLKVIAASLGVGLIILFVGGFLFLLDLYHLENTATAQQGLLGLHVYARGLYLWTLAIAA